MEVLRTMIIVILAAFVIGALSVALCLSQVVDPDRLRELRRRIWHPRFTIRQLMAAVALIAVLLIIGNGPSPEGRLALMLLVLWALFWFARAWQKEFVFLMGLRDDQFPGRHDKLIWVVLLLAMAPIGVWFFRAYRLAHWPEPAAAVDEKGWAGEADGATAQPA
jgi:hypothetical protein